MVSFYVYINRARRKSIIRELQGCVWLCDCGKERSERRGEGGGGGKKKIRIGEVK